MEKNKENRPKVGIGALVIKDGKLLLGKRKNNVDGQGEYAAPGGHLEYMESIEDCARREIKEETGMEVGDIKFLCLYNMKDYPPHHFINIAMLCEWKSGEPKVMEPDKCEGWDWYPLDNLPEPLYKSYPVLLDAIKNGKYYYDS